MDNSNQIQGGIGISLVDVFGFLVGAWRKLLLAGLSGAILGASLWFFLGAYSAEYVLQNAGNSNALALNLVSWKMLQRGLPHLAVQISNNDKASENQGDAFKAFASEEWWYKNVKPGFALSKADLKDLPSSDKYAVEAGNTIVNFTLNMTGSSESLAIDNVKLAANFMRTGGSYLELRNLISDYASDMVVSQAQIQKEISSTEIDLSYYYQQVRMLEELNKRFPRKTTIGLLTVDQNDLSNKSLSISGQIIDANNRINKSKESLQRYNDQLTQIAVMKVFIEKASPLMDQNFDGLMLCTKLLEIEKQLRSDLADKDTVRQVVLDGIRLSLHEIQTRFTHGLEPSSPPVSSGRKGIVKSTVGGFAASFFLMFLLLMGARLWAHFRSYGADDL